MLFFEMVEFKNERVVDSDSVSVTEIIILNNSLLVFLVSIIFYKVISNFGLPQYI